MVQLAALIACQTLNVYRVMLGAALSIGMTPVEAKEIVYQAVPYLGMTKVLDFPLATNDVLTDRGIQLPLEGQSTTTPETREDEGLAIQKEIVGAERVAQIYAAPDGEAHIQRLLSANCFGDHYTRAGIDLKTRELLTFAILAAHGGCDPQVRGHVAANVNVGNDCGVLLAVVTQLVPFIGYARTPQRARRDQRDRARANRKALSVMRNSRSSTKRCPVSAAIIRAAMRVPDRCGPVTTILACTARCSNISQAPCLARTAIRTSTKPTMPVLRYSR
jgi:4-carboxymuconolactone decarboxylase